MWNEGEILNSYMVMMKTVLDMSVEGSITTLSFPETIWESKKYAQQDQNVCQVLRNPSDSFGNETWVVLATKLWYVTYS